MDVELPSSSAGGPPTGQRKLTTSPARSGAEGADGLGGTGGESSGQQATHVHGFTTGQPVQQFRGSQVRLIGPTLGIPGVLDQPLDAIDRARSAGLVGQRQPGQRPGQP